MPTSIQNKITFISAGAGSGKTFRLTEILHRELAKGNFRPSGVIATTFTKKAAAELRERVRGHLLNRGDFVRANEVGQAHIGTINSICGHLISRFSFEVGLSTDLLVLDEDQAKFEIDKTIDLVLSAAEMTRFQGITRRMGFDESDWKQDLQTLINQIRTNDIDLARLPAIAVSNANDLISRLPDTTPRDLTGELRTAIEDALPVLRPLADLKAEPVPKGAKANNKYLSILEPFVNQYQSKYVPWSEWLKLSKQEPAKNAMDAIQSIRDITSHIASHPDFQRDIKEYLEIIFKLAGGVLQKYNEKKSLTGALDFADQEHIFLNLLDNKSVQSALKDELDLLMVDEFQDTSPIQLAIFLKLAALAKKVYWVGDIKQAIYGFRGSDTNLMKSVINELPNLQATLEVLPSSWRSRRELVQIVNEVFVDAFAGLQATNQIALNPTRTDTLNNYPFANWFLAGENKQEEMASLAVGIDKLVKSGYTIYDKKLGVARSVTYGDIAILSRFNDGVVGIAKGLTDKGIPAATDQSGLLKTAEITLVLACIRRLNDPLDTVSTAEIISLYDSLDPECWLVDRISYVETVEKDELPKWKEISIGESVTHPVITKIAEIRKLLPMLSPTEALRKTITSCNLLERLISWSPTEDQATVRLSNVEALLNFCKKYEEQVQNHGIAASVTGFLKWIEDLRKNEKDMLAQPSINAVNVLTHHGAKGLEWPVVILSDLDAEPKSRLWSISPKSTQPFSVTSPLQNRTIRYWPWPFGKQKKSPVFDEITRELEEEYQSEAVEEGKRLLYVSMTRARDLMVFARSSRNPSGPWLDSLNAPWLNPEGNLETPMITLPSRTQILSSRWNLNGAEYQASVPVVENEVVYWTRANLAKQEKQVLTFNPSASVQTTSFISEKVILGGPIQLQGAPNMANLGTAIHGCIGLSFTDVGKPLAKAEVTRLLSAYKVEHSISSEELMKQISIFIDWIKQRWPNASATAELPVQALMPNGQFLNGRLDLILETADGWIIIDHKSSVRNQDEWSSLAQQYGSQLEAYASAVLLATNKPVLENWLYLPVSGGCIKLETLKSIRCE